MKVIRNWWMLGGVLIVTSLLASFGTAADKATRKFVAADSSKRRVAIVDETVICVGQGLGFPVDQVANIRIGILRSGGAQ